MATARGGDVTSQTWSSEGDTPIRGALQFYRFLTPIIPLQRSDTYPQRCRMS